MGTANFKAISEGLSRLRAETYGKQKISRNTIEGYVNLINIKSKLLEGRLDPLKDIILMSCFLDHPYFKRTNKEMAENSIDGKEFVDLLKLLHKTKGGPRLDDNLDTMRQSLQLHSPTYGLYALIIKMFEWFRWQRDTLKLILHIIQHDQFQQWQDHEKAAETSDAFTVRSLFDLLDVVLQYDVTHQMYLWQMGPLIDNLCIVLETTKGTVACVVEQNGELPMRPVLVGYHTTCEDVREWFYKVIFDLAEYELSVSFPEPVEDDICNLVQKIDELVGKLSTNYLAQSPDSKVLDLKKELVSTYKQYQFKTIGKDGQLFSMLRSESPNLGCLDINLKQIDSSERDEAHITIYRYMSIPSPQIYQAFHPEDHAPSERLLEIRLFRMEIDRLKGIDKQGTPSISRHDQYLLHVVEHPVIGLILYPLYLASREHNNNVPDAFDVLALRFGLENFMCSRTVSVDVDKLLPVVKGYSDKCLSAYNNLRYTGLDKSPKAINLGVMERRAESSSTYLNHYEVRQCLEAEMAMIVDFLALFNLTMPSISDLSWLTDIIDRYEREPERYQDHAQVDKDAGTLLLHIEEITYSLGVFRNDPKFKTAGVAKPKSRPRELTDVLLAAAKAAQVNLRMFDFLLSSERIRFSQSSATHLPKRYYGIISEKLFGHQIRAKAEIDLERALQSRALAIMKYSVPENLDEWTIISNLFEDCYEKIARSVCLHPGLFWKNSHLYNERDWAVDAAVTCIDEFAARPAKDDVKRVEERVFFLLKKYYSSIFQFEDSFLQESWMQGEMGLFIHSQLLRETSRLYKIALKFVRICVENGFVLGKILQFIPLNIDTNNAQTEFRLVFKGPINLSMKFYELMDEYLLHKIYLSNPPATGNDAASARNVGSAGIGEGTNTAQTRDSPAREEYTHLLSTRNTVTISLLEGPDQMASRPLEPEAADLPSIYGGDEECKLAMASMRSPDVICGAMVDRCWDIANENNSPLYLDTLCLTTLAISKLETDQIRKIFTMTGKNVLMYPEQANLVLNGMNYLKIELLLSIMEKTQISKTHVLMHILFLTRNVELARHLGPRINMLADSLFFLWTYPEHCALIDVFPNNKYFLQLLTQGCLANMGTEPFAKLTAEQTKHLPSHVLNMLTLKKFSCITPEALNGIEVGVLRSLSTSYCGHLLGSMSKLDPERQACVESNCGSPMVAEVFLMVIFAAFLVIVGAILLRLRSLHRGKTRSMSLSGGLLPSGRSAIDGPNTR